MSLDDAWTYSDPSLDSLEANDTKHASSKDLAPKLDIPEEDTTLLYQDEIIDSSNDHQIKKDSIVVSAPPKATIMPTPDSTSTSIPKNPITISHTISKAVPANPLTTKQDVESIKTTNSSASSIDDQLSEISQSQPPSTPTQNGTFFNNMFNAAASSLSFGRNGESQPSDVGDITLTLEGHLRTNSADSTMSSPNFMSYRRSKKASDRKRTSSSTFLESPSSPLVQDVKPSSESSEEFDARLYVDEKFRNTAYRYATIPRNEEYHKLFKSIPEKERLLDDFSCALSREILLQGRLYVSENNICFNSNLLGWVTNLVIPFNEIIAFEKTATVGLFQTGISIVLKNGRHSFASFISRDSTFDKLKGIVEAFTDNVKNDDTLLSKLSEENGFLSKSISVRSGSFDDEYNRALMSIDGDSPGTRRNSARDRIKDSYHDGSDDDENDGREEEYADSESSSSSNELNNEPKLSTQTIFKLKNDSKFAYTGPYAHRPTVSDYSPEANKETILAKVNFKCAPGLLFELLFGDNNELVLTLLRSQDSSEFTEFSKYENNESNHKERSYEYKKGLNYSVGPKSTKCLVKETIEHKDFDGYINAINTTKTPDVPSGNAFSVKTRYIITWGADNTSTLVISFWVDWTGSSWMKSVIERSCKSGQEAATSALLELLEKYVADNTEPTIEDIAIVPSLSLEDIPESIPIEIAKEQITVENTKVTPSATYQFSFFKISVISLLLLILSFQILIFASLTSPKSFKFSSIKSFAPSTEELLFKGEEILLWDWIEKRAGSLNGNENTKTLKLKRDIDEVIGKWTTGKLNTKEGKQLIRDFGTSLNEYTKAGSSDLSEEEKLILTDSLKRAVKVLI